MNKLISKSFTLLMAIVSAGLLAGCSEDKVSGGITEDAGLAVKNLDVAGLAQKGPFIKGSAVTVQGVDCKTMKFTEENFEGKVKSDKGDFGVDDVNLSASCALFTVSGYYLNEFTGKKSSDKLTLHAISDLSDRKSVNINVLTELEYERVMKLVSEEKMSFDEAKMRAEKEILSSLGVMDLFESFEGLSIYEKGDGNATLLATSVLLQSDLDSKKLADRMDSFASSIEKTGEWNDEKTKTEMADWASAAEADGKFGTVRENLEKWSGSDEIPEFEKVVVVINTTQKIPEGWSWDVPKEARLNPKIKYDTMIDPRDKQVYKIVKIEVKDKDYSEVWMAENLNYADSVKTPSLKGGNWCYKGDEKNCKVGGRYYSWAAAIDSVALANDSKDPLNCGNGKTCELNHGVQGICPDGWHLPTLLEWGLLSEAMGPAAVAGEPLKALTGWDYAGTDDNNGTDLYGFAALPTGRRISATSWEKVGSDVYYWSSDERNASDGRYFNINNIYTNSYTYQNKKTYGQSVRCIKGKPLTSSVVSSNGKVTSGWSWDVPKELRLNPKIKYDSMVDPRDKQVYKVVKIEVKDKNYSQVWMAENLNYADSVRTPSLKGKNWCYNNNEKNCKVSGRYYSWSAAIDSIALANDPKDPLNCGYGRTCGINRGVQGICPDGWHLPTLHEWGLLSVALGNAPVSGAPLKALTGWNYAGTDDNNGTDEYGFAALPTGRRISATSWEKVGSDVYYWSSEELDSEEGRYSNINNIYTNFYTYHGRKTYGQSVRCIKGDASTAAIKSSSSSSVGDAKSSSSQAKSSSSVVTSSSSVVPSGWSWDVPKEARLNPNIKYDTIVDSRDKRVYKVVKIEVKDMDYSQVWMAENLNYADSAKTPSLKGRNWCYRDSAKYCEVSGRYYSWAAAIDSVALANDTLEPLNCGYGKTCGLDHRIQGICPDGWHLPSIDEWGRLSVALGNAGVSGAPLKALTGWDYAGTDDNNGTDEFGFAALPTGRRISATSWEKVGSDVYFWSYDEDDAYDARYSNINNLYTKFYLFQNSKNYGQSIRCAKD